MFKLLNLEPGIPFPEEFGVQTSVKLRGSLDNNSKYCDLGSLWLMLGNLSFMNFVLSDTPELLFLIKEFFKKPKETKWSQWIKYCYLNLRDWALESAGIERITCTWLHAVHLPASNETVVYTDLGLPDYLKENSKKYYFDTAKQRYVLYKEPSEKEMYDLLIGSFYTL